ncbi:hypothetical protein GIB67_042317 [Kingdonia uniflora]|uniref:Uncharacterized protein n=1 Tax=Kingdonia uniflora TaxID=39325 RepID=A0A7J7LEF9_9MAGN|nr:hypothetical protein GIB67_042317 [Kingdonia uniflora]
MASFQSQKPVAKDTNVQARPKRKNAGSKIKEMAMDVMKGFKERAKPVEQSNSKAEPNTKDSNINIASKKKEDKKENEKEKKEKKEKKENIVTKESDEKDEKKNKNKNKNKERHDDNIDKDGHDKKKGCLQKQETEKKHK